MKKVVAERSLGDVFEEFAQKDDIGQLTISETVYQLREIYQTNNSFKGYFAKFRVSDLPPYRRAEQSI